MHHSMKSAGEGEAFWRFSLAFYAQPGVAAALIELQDRSGRDVNAMLYGLWLGVVRGETMTAAAAAAPPADAAVELRALRRRLRADPEPDIQALRRRVQAVEIAAERVAQARLAASAGQPSKAAGRAEAAAANFALAAGEPPPEAVARAIGRFTRRA